MLERIIGRRRYCTKPGSGTGVVVEKCVQLPVVASRYSTLIEVG